MADFENLEHTDRKIIVGIDFGTTYSGVAWAETMRPSHREVLTAWPIDKFMLEGESSKKVPTKIRYAGTDGNDVEWGFAIPSGLDMSSADVNQWFKLDLVPSYTNTNVARPDRNLVAARGGRTVDRLITDYISALGTHLHYMLRRQLGEDVAEHTPFEFVITVPAIWNDSAKDRMLRACRQATGLRAGDSAIQLVSEPEAAAIFTLHGMDTDGLEVDDSFVVCDAGGGTVDLITYTVTALKPVAKVEEAVPGDGGFCGSNFLNDRFADLLQAKLGALPDFDDEVKDHAMDVFEKDLKRQFPLRAQPGQTFRIPVNGLPNNKKLGIGRGWLTLDWAELKAKVFEPVVKQVVDLVEEQIFASKKSIRAVCLVGGFGASVYLRERIRETVDAKIQVMQPPNAWTAVVMGAVMKGLAMSAVKTPIPNMIWVTDRRARKHYGYPVGVAYMEDLHGHIANKRYWDAKDAMWRIEVVHWLIRRGDLVSENKPFCNTYAFDRLVRDGRLKSLSTTICCDSVSADAPLLRDASVVTLCNVEADISRIPEQDLHRELGKDGQMYYFFRVELETVFRSASTEYTLIYKGKRYDSVKAEYV